MRDDPIHAGTTVAGAGRLWRRAAALTAVALAALVAVTGCATGGGGADGDAALMPSAAAEGESSPAPMLLPGGGRGIEVYELLVPATDAARAELWSRLAQLGEPTMIEGDQLRSNGLCLVLIEGADPRQATKAATSFVVERSGVLGTIDRWQPLGGAWRQNRSGGAIMLDGRPKRLAPSDAGLVVRGWPTLTEDGPEYYLEFAAGQAPSTVRTPMRLGRTSGRIEALGSLWAAASVRSDALLVVDRWRGEAPWLLAEAGEDEPGADAAAAGQGPGMGFGPGVELPPTLADLVLGGDSVGDADRVLLMLPRVGTGPDDEPERATGGGNAEPPAPIAPAPPQSPAPTGVLEPAGAS